MHALCRQYAGDGLESKQQGDIAPTKKSKTESQGELKDLIY